jgi:hypothetical protein
MSDAFGEDGEQWVSKTAQRWFRNRGCVRTTSEKARSAELLAESAFESISSQGVAALSLPQEVRLYRGR